MVDEIDKLIKHPERYSGVANNRRKPHLRLWHSPTWQPHVVWSLHPDLGSVPKGKVPLSSYILRRLTITEGETTPRVYGTEARPALKEIGRILDTLHAIKLPPFPPIPETEGRDGSAYGVAWGNMYNQVEFSWWQGEPDEWVELAKWFEQTVAYFDAILPEQQA